MSGDQDPQNRQRYRQQRRIPKKNASTQSTTTKGSESTTNQSLPTSIPTPVTRQLDGKPMSSNSASSSMTTLPPRVVSSIRATTPQNRNPNQETNKSYNNIQVGNSVIRVEAKETIKIPMNQMSKLYQTLKNRFEK